MDVVLGMIGFFAFVIVVAVVAQISDNRRGKTKGLQKRCDEQWALITDIRETAWDFRAAGSDVVSDMVLGKIAAYSQKKESK